MAATGFTGTDNTELTTADADWTKAAGATGNLEFVGTDTVRQTNTTYAAYIHADAPSSADQDVSVSVVTPSGGYGAGAVGILLRWDNATQNGYLVRVNANNAAYQIFKLTSGSMAQLGADATWSVPSSSTVKTMRAVISGTSTTTIEMYWDGAGSPTVSRTDSSSPHTGVGKVGIRTNAVSSPTDTVSLQARNFVDSTTVPAATGTTMTGPTTGNVGVASSNFTAGVTPVGGTITGTVTITPSDGGDGGTFTPTTVDLTTSSPTATFTYTAASAGAKTISITDNGGLSDATDITYTASALGPTIDTQPTAQTVNEGSAATYSVAATTSGGSLTYQWQRANPGSGSFSNVGGATSSSYTTAATGCASDHGAQYKCNVTDSNGTVATSAVGLTVRSVTTTSRPSADVTTTSWTTSTGTDFYALIDETSASDADYIDSPTITGTPEWIVMSLQYPLATGERMVPVKASVSTGTGTLKVRLQDDTAAVVGNAVDQAVDDTPTVYNLPITLSGPATRIAFAFI